MLLGKADEGAAVDLVRDGGGDDAPGPAAGCWVNRGPVALVSGVALISGNPAGWNVTSGRLPARIRGQKMYPWPVRGAGIPCMPGPGRDPICQHGVLIGYLPIAMREEIRKAGLRFAFGLKATARCREPGAQIWRICVRSRTRVARQEAARSRRSETRRHEHKVTLRDCP